MGLNMIAQLGIVQISLIFISIKFSPRSTRSAMERILGMIIHYASITFKPINLIAFENR